MSKDFFVTLHLILINKFAHKTSAATFVLWTATSVVVRSRTRTRHELSNRNIVPAMCNFVSTPLTYRGRTEET